MKTSLVLTVLGIDKPGVVEALSETVLSHDANWEESRMAHLAGRFAGVLRVSVLTARADLLSQALASLESPELRVVVERTDVSEAPPSFRSLRLDLVGSDRSGIIRDISRALASRGVNVEELNTTCDHAPMAGGMLFRASAALRAPLELDLAELRDALEALAHDLMVDIALDQDSE